MWKRVLAVLFAVALIATACGDDNDDVTAADNEATTGAADLQLSSSDLGDILVDQTGATLYLFLPDKQGASTCYDECEANWPVLGEITTVGDGLDGALVGTTERTDGAIQATYNGWPLYYFVNDLTVGETKGQGLNEVWYVVDARGNGVGAG